MAEGGNKKFRRKWFPGKGQQVGGESSNRGAKFVIILSLLLMVVTNLLRFSEDSSEWRIQQMLENDSIDMKYGFERVSDALERTGFLLNMHTVRLNNYLHKL